MVRLYIIDALGKDLGVGWVMGWKNINDKMWELDNGKVLAFGWVEVPTDADV